MSKKLTACRVGFRVQLNGLCPSSTLSESDMDKTYEAFRSAYDGVQAQLESCVAPADVALETFRNAVDHYTLGAFNPELDTYDGVEVYCLWFEYENLPHPQCEAELRALQALCLANIDKAAAEATMPWRTLGAQLHLTWEATRWQELTL